VHIAQNAKVPPNDDEVIGIGAASSGGRSAWKNNSDFAGYDHGSPVARCTYLSSASRVLKEGMTNSRM
jgi:hypothetical protein